MFFLAHHFIPKPAQITSENGKESDVGTKLNNTNAGPSYANQNKFAEIEVNGNDAKYYNVSVSHGGNTEMEEQKTNIIETLSENDEYNPSDIMPTGAEHQLSRL